MYLVQNITESEWESLVMISDELPVLVNYVHIRQMQTLSDDESHTEQTGLVILG